jgi:hypothetical protein
MSKSLTYIEIDVPSFVGTSPETIVTYRFSKPTAYSPRDIEAIPSMASLSFSPARISLGENLGERASLKITFKDHKHIFDAEEFDSGTFWGKWRARHGTKLRGRTLRWYQGLLGQTLEQMEVRQFIIDSTNGPTPSGEYSIVAKDILKLADNDRAQAPLLSDGYLVSGIDTVETSISLTPTGIGDAEYPASGYVAIGGSEICSFTRSGNNLTIVRGQLGTDASEHDSGERVQLVLIYTAEDPGDIIKDLLVNYANISADFIPISAWNTETGSFLQTLYSAVISEPESVNKLVSELIEQAALALWWEPMTPELRLKVLRKIATDVDLYSPNNTLEGTLQISEQPGTRISQIWTYYGQRNSLKPVEDTDNYRSVAITVDLESETEYGGPAIKKIFSRWIPFGARTVALRLNELLLSRYVDPPRTCTFALWRYGSEDPTLGGGYRLESWCLQTIDGAPTDMPIQITRVNPTEDRYEVQADEMLAAEIAAVDLSNRIIIIDSNVYNINLKDLHDQIYPEIEGGESPEITLTVYIEEGVIIGSKNTSWSAFFVGGWGDPPPITIYCRGRIQGMGGRGGDGSVDAHPQNGSPGGGALQVEHPITLVLNDGNGEIWGGGGGGAGAGVTGSGGGGGGGGAGSDPGDGGAAGFTDPGEPGTTDSGGGGGSGDAGDGGDPGQAGGSSPQATGGAAGYAIYGIGNVNKIGSGDIRGSES